MKIRELGSLCLAPVVLMGYLALTDIQSRKFQSTVDNGAIIEVQTCEKGLGLDVKAATNGLYGTNLQYGFQYKPTADTSLTFTPKLGISYVDHPVRELPQRTQFGLGGAFTAGYGNARISVEYWHLSNGKDLGLAVTDKAKENPNIGLDMIAIMGGWVF